MKIAVIGGGVSGLAAAISAAQNNNAVTIFEKNSKVLKKLLLTGNGKCNYFNEDQDISHYHTTSNIAINQIINPNNISKVKDFWDTLGVIPFIKNGYYYPYSENAHSIKSLLVNKASSLNIKIITDSEVTSITKEKDVFHITANNYNGDFDKVIITTGSYAYPQTGSTGFGYDIAKNFKHTIMPVNPSLVQLVTNLGIEDKWSGVRCHGRVTDLTTGKTEFGEIQFTNYGISGICIFNISRDISIRVSLQQESSIMLNLVPWYSGNNFSDYLEKRAQAIESNSIIELCETFINYKLLIAICSYRHIDSHKSWSELNKREKEEFCQSLTNLEIPIVGTKDYNSAQVCSGGINLAELNLATLESKLVKNLYFCGEILDLDGDCGGYNLTIAILTGILAGASC